MIIKSILLLYLISFSQLTPITINKSRKDRAILPIAALVVISALVITPIIIGSVITGYLITYVFQDKNGEKCKSFKIIQPNIITNKDEKLVRVNFPFVIRLDDARLIISLENFNEYIFKKIGEILDKPDLENICFQGFIISNFRNYLKFQMLTVRK